MLLTSHRFWFTTQNRWGFMGLPLDSAPHIRLALAEYKDETGMIPEIDVLIKPQIFLERKSPLPYSQGIWGKIR